MMEDEIEKKKKKKRTTIFTNHIGISHSGCMVRFVAFASRQLVIRRIELFHDGTERRLFKLSKYFFDTT
jgi:hypothetical protein